MSFGVSLHPCAICKKPVNLTESKADEYGQVVHEDCYVWMLVPNNARPKPVANTHRAFNPASEGRFPPARAVI